MPLPKPKATEDKDEFMEQCMSNNTMLEEHADVEEKTAVCQRQWADAKRTGPLLIERTVKGEPSITREGAGTITGYAFTWGFDKDGIRFLPGSFDKTLSERAGQIPLLIKHSRDGSAVLEAIGFVVRGEDDEKGLLVTAEFLDTELAQSVREVGLKGGIKAMSGNAKGIKYKRAKNGVAEVTEALLREVTVTNIPLDPDAKVHSVRGDSEESRAESPCANEPDSGRGEASESTQEEKGTAAKEPSTPDGDEDTPTGEPPEVNAERIRREAQLKLLEVQLSCSSKML